MLSTFIHKIINNISMYNSVGTIKFVQKVFCPYFTVHLKRIPLNVMSQLVDITKSILPYSGKVWQEESLANLVNCQWFAKLKLSKIEVIIIILWLNLFVRQTFPRQTLKKSKFAKVYPPSNFPTICYTLEINTYKCWKLFCL